MRPQVRFEKIDTVAIFLKKELEGVGRSWKELEGVWRSLEEFGGVWRSLEKNSPKFILTFHQHNSLILQFIGQVYATQIKGV